MAEPADGDLRISADRLRWQERRLAALGYLTAHRLHELNNLVMILTGHIELLQLQGLPADLLERSQRAAWRTSEILRDLTALSVEEGREVSWAQVFDVITTLYGRRMEAEGIAWQVTAPADLAVRGDPLLLGEVIAELVFNAIEALAGAATRRIEATVRIGDGGVEIAIADSGHGLSPEQASRAFEPGWSGQSDARRPPVFLDLGIGLTRARELVEASGGSLQLQARPEGGTEALIRLPA